MPLPALHNEGREWQHAGIAACPRSVRLSRGLRWRYWGPVRRNGSVHPAIQKQWQAFRQRLDTLVPLLRNAHIPVRSIVKGTVMRLVLIYLFAIVLSIPSVAQGTPSAPTLNRDSVRFGAALPPTEVSGIESPEPIRLEARGPDGRLFGLYGAKFLEKSDEPCHIVGMFERAADTNSDAIDVWSSCGDQRPPNAKSAAVVGFGDVDGHDRRAFVTSVEVCLNNTKIKGARFGGVHISRRGRIRPISPSLVSIGGVAASSFVPSQPNPSSPLFWRTYCTRPGTNKWQAAASCPEGSAATALIIHHFAAGGSTDRRQATGLQLECRNVIGSQLPATVPSNPAR